MVPPPGIDCWALIMMLSRTCPIWFLSMLHGRRFSASLNWHEIFDPLSANRAVSWINVTIGVVFWTGEPPLANVSS